MKLEKAKEYLRNLIKNDGTMDEVKALSYFYGVEAVETVLQELDRLQKENEELISEKTKLLLTDLAEANRLYDEENKRCMMFAIENNDLKEKLNNSINKGKIRELIEKETIDISGFECIALEDIQNLLKEE